jgi:spermidine synthase
VRLPPVPAYPIATDHVTVEIRADRRRAGGRLLLMDGVEASHVDLVDPTHLEFEYLRHLARLLEAAHPPRRPLDAVQVGGGPCTLARHLTATRPNARMTVIERDAGIVAVAREHLALRESARLRVVVGEGRAVIGALPDASADLVVIDAFDGVVAPHHLLTAEFAGTVRRVLRPGGVHVVNLIDIPPLGLASAAAATLAAAYRNLALVADEAVLAHDSAGNVLLAASDAALPVEALAREAARDPAPWRVRTGRPLERMLAGAPVLEDDVAPEHALAVLAPLWGRRSRRRDGPS